MSELGAVLRLDVLDFGRMGSERLARLRDQMRAQGVDGAVLLHGPNVSYATGCVPEAVDASHANHRRAVAIVGAAGGPLRLHTHDPAGDAAADCAEAGAPLWPELDDGAAAVGAAIAEVLGDVTGLRVAVDAVTGAMARAGVLDGAELVDASRVLGPARVIKTDDELACIDQSQRHTERAMGRGPGCLRARRHPGRGCRCLPGRPAPTAAPAPASTIATGSTPSSSPCLCTATAGRAPRRAMWPSPPGSTTPFSRRGDLVWVDAGVGWHGYMSDFGRTWVAGREPDIRPSSRCSTVGWRCWRPLSRRYAPAQLSATSLGPPGPSSRGRRRGCRSFYLAHGTGLESAEMPMIGTDLGSAFDDGYELAAGMVLVFEPVIWVDGVGGYRAEEIVAVTDDGWRPLGGGHHYEPFGS